MQDIHQAQVVLSFFLFVFLGNVVQATINHWGMVNIPPIYVMLFGVLRCFWPHPGHPHPGSQDALDAGGCLAGDQRLPLGDLRLQTRHGSGRTRSASSCSWAAAADLLRFRWCSTSRCAEGCWGYLSTYVRSTYVRSIFQTLFEYCSICSKHV